MFLFCIFNDMYDSHPLGAFLKDNLNELFFFPSPVYVALSSCVQIWGIVRLAFPVVITMFLFRRVRIYKMFPVPLFHYSPFYIEKDPRDGLLCDGSVVSLSAVCLTGLNLHYLPKLHRVYVFQFICGRFSSREADMGSWIESLLSAFKFSWGENVCISYFTWKFGWTRTNWASRSKGILIVFHYRERYVIPFSLLFSCVFDIRHIFARSHAYFEIHFVLSVYCLKIGKRSPILNK